MTTRPPKRIPKAIQTALRKHNVVEMADMRLARDAAVKPSEDEEGYVTSLYRELEKKLDEAERDALQRRQLELKQAQLDQAKRDAL